MSDKIKDPADPLTEMCETQSGFSRDLADFRAALAQNQKVMQDVVSQLATLPSQQRPSIPDTTRHRGLDLQLHPLSQGVSYPTLRHKPVPVELGRFHGDNVEAWFFQAEKYFKFYSIEDSHKLTLASFYLDVEALDWYRWLYRNKQLIDWDHFAAKLRSRFKKCLLLKPEGHLSKLR